MRMNLFEEIKRQVQHYRNMPRDFVCNIIDEFKEKWQCRNCKHMEDADICDQGMCDKLEIVIDTDFFCRDFEE